MEDRVKSQSTHRLLSCSPTTRDQKALRGGSCVKARRKTTRDVAAVTLWPFSRRFFVEQPVSGLYKAAAYYTAAGKLNYPDPPHSRLAPLQSISRKTKKRSQRSLAPRPKWKKTAMPESIPRENLKHEEDRVQAVFVNKQKEEKRQPSERTTVQKLAKVRTTMTGSVPKRSMNRFEVQPHPTKASFQQEQHVQGVDRNSLTLIPEVEMPASPVSIPSLSNSPLQQPVADPPATTPGRRYATISATRASAAASRPAAGHASRSESARCQTKIAAVEKTTSPSTEAG